MLEIEDDIWAYWPHAWIAIPTNIGWTDVGMNIMGVGLAKQAADRCPDLPLWYGSWCKTFGEATPVMANREHCIVLFPTKPLDANKPNLSWKQPSSLGLIERGLKQLVELDIQGDVMVPLLGCGAGRLIPSEVVPLMKRYLTDNRFILVQQPVATDHPF